MLQHKSNSRPKTTETSQQPPRVLFTVRLPRELVQRVGAEARNAKRPTSRQDEFFLERVLVTSRP